MPEERPLRGSAIPARLMLSLARLIPGFLHQRSGTLEAGTPKRSVYTICLRMGVHLLPRNLMRLIETG